VLIDAENRQSGEIFPVVENTEDHRNNPPQKDTTMALRPSTPSIRRRIGRTGGVSLAAAALLLASGCSVLNGSSGSDNSSGSSCGNLEKSTINVAAQPFVDAVPLYIAQQKGYFKQACLTVKITSLPSATTIIPKVTANSIDIGEGNYASVMEAQVKKTGDFTFVAGASEGRPGSVEVMALPSANINSAKDLVGKKIAINTLDDVLYAAFAAVLQANNVDLNSVTMVKIKHADIPQNIGDGAVQAGLEVEPYKTEAARKFGARPVVDLFQGPAANLPFNSYFANTSFVKNNPKTVAAFVTALEKAAADANGNRKDVESVLPTITGVDPTTASLVALPNFPTTLSTKQVQRVSDLMHTYNLEAPANVSSMVYALPASNGS
jgi:NitT/TauT family transport system substrate-binding protein